jgi:sec-independent protein translocase protein TatA
VPRINGKKGVNMFGLGTPELVVIMLICVILFGGRRLPELGSGLGKAIRNFRGATQEIEREIQTPVEKKDPS